MQPYYKYSKGPIFSRPRRFLVEKRVIFMTLIQIVPTVVMKQTIRSPSPTCRLVGSAVLPVGRPGDKFSHHVSVTASPACLPARAFELCVIKTARFRKSTAVPSTAIASTSHH